MQKRTTSLAKPIFILNGPNLNLLGLRQPEIYGRETLEDVADACSALADDLGLTIRFHQSNHEGQLVDWIHEARQVGAGIIINPAAYTHTSVAILDALNAFDGPVLEVHISNVHKRESFRHHSYVSLRAEGVIAGFGTEGYQLALRRMLTLVSK
jgi:3-dehydroquinate dehydratase-2